MNEKENIPSPPRSTNRKWRNPDDKRGRTSPKKKIPQIGKLRSTILDPIRVGWTDNSEPSETVYPLEFFVVVELERVSELKPLLAGWC